LIIVFQPELRRFLEQLGSNRLGDIFGGDRIPDE
jgi:diadenylate cyclase